MKFRHALFIISLLCALFLESALAVCVFAQTDNARRARVAVLDFGETPVGPRVAERFSAGLFTAADFQLVDRDASRAAARGAGYAGSLNLTLQEARDLGAAIGCDFFITGDAQVLRRSPSTGPIYYEAYASIFAVSARTGNLLRWERPGFEASTPAEALRLLLAEIDKGEWRARYLNTLRTAQLDERQRALVSNNEAATIALVPEEGSPEAAGLRLPQPYRRLRPAYPETAARAEAEASVDVILDLDAEGEVTRVLVARWAGFGLDEATLETVRQLHFRPAMRDGTPLPMRILLRYNFRKPKRDEAKK
ncbi:MAG TPA: energy transducer TonB [Pyrinomonadaceae bacterium]|jgi:TonB family protein|nr:energy transducer TonB [Pyrinomonadaceae bacterium]